MSSDHEDHVAREIELHEALARVYTEQRYRPAFSSLFQKHWNRRMTSLAGLAPGAIVVDFGCGTGILLPDLVEAGLHPIGLDVSADMLLAAPGLPGSLRLRADGCRMPVMDASVDAVLCRGSIHHLPDLEGAFTEIARVLKRGGTLVFSEPSNDSPVNRAARYVMYRRSAEFNVDDEGLRRKEILPMLARQGFVVEHSRGFGFLAYTFAGFPDKLNVLARVPGATLFTRVLIAVDSLLERLPLVHAFALHWQVRARKR
jgi:ubiquinone/menaquinone biosynthesis C-methylase UbiE